MITISTTSPAEARAMTAMLQAAPAGLSYRVYLSGHEVAASVTAAGRRAAAGGPGYHGEGELADFDPRTGRSSWDDWGK